MKQMIFGLIVALVLPAASQAVEVAIVGASAKLMFKTFETRKEGVTKSSTKSLLGSAVEVLKLHDFIVCRKKDGWFSVSYRCSVSDTDFQDINGTNVISVGGDALNDLFADVSHEVNRNTTATIRGMSATLLYKKLEAIEGKDWSFYKKTGQTRYLKRDYTGLGIGELYCQQTKGMFGLSTQCVLPNVRTSETNVRVVVATPAKMK